MTTPLVFQFGYIFFHLKKDLAFYKKTPWILVFKAWTKYDSVLGNMAYLAVLMLGEFIAFKSSMLLFL